MKTIEQVQKEGLVAKCCGTVYTTKEFFERVNEGSFIPYDGDGFFHNGEDETNRCVWDNNITSEEVKQYSYVCWYNR